MSPNESPNEYFRHQFTEEIKRTRDALGMAFDNLDLGFVCLDFLDEIFKPGNPNKLQESLQEDLENLEAGQLFSAADLEKLELAVRNRAPKLYGILLMINQSKRIVELMKMDPPIDDTVFETSQGSKLSWCSLERLSKEKPLRDIAAEIYEKQWLIPPKFNSETHENFPQALFRFPFVGEAPAYENSGSWGIVYRAKVADRHLPSCPVVQKKGIVAFKSIKKEDNTEWNNLLKEAETLRARKHDHIVPLLASFSAGQSNREPNDKSEHLWLLMPYAEEGSMKEWLELPARGNIPWGEDSFRCDHIRKTMLGLVSALAYIHREINGVIGFHHDIKPSNIILFVNPEPVWKICDFGTANLKDPKEGTGTAYMTGNRFGTYTYRPPEFADEGSPKHGRAFDVYSLGCVLLELATVFTYGWKPEGLIEFERQRRNTPDPTYEGREKPPDDVSFHNCPTVVMSWIERLKDKNQSAEEPQDFSDMVQVLDIISEMLGERYSRIFAWEVEMDFYEIFNPTASVEERAKRLRKIVQQSAKPLDQTKEQHNPMSRAISHNKEQWYTDILQGRNWHYSARFLSRRSTSTTFDTHNGRRGPFTNLNKPSLTGDFRVAHFFGRHDIHEKIIRGFHGRNPVIGLFGKSGVGKSHSAYYYASGFQEPKDHKAHTFWVDCKDRNSMIESFREILMLTSTSIAPRCDNSSVIPLVTEWLSNAATGPWMMVLDGLEDENIAHDLNKTLPMSGGEILITTKNKNVLTAFLNVNKKDAFIQMEELPPLTASYIFDSHINRDLSTSTKSRDFLVKRLPLPALIISMAEHMNRNTYTTENLQNDELSGGSRTIEEQYKNFSTRLLGPLVTNLGDSQHTSEKLDLLGELSCLDAARIEFTLLLQVHTKPDRLQSQLSGLEHCSLISTVENRVYNMQEYVQVAVLQWFQMKWGDERVLQLYVTALCMLYKRYDHETHERHIQVSGKARVPSRQWKLPYKPHFDRFLEFARKNKDKASKFAACKINGIEVMVLAVVTFSKLYLEEHRYDDAICVLEFAEAIYEGSKWRYELKRLLIRAYLEKPLRHEQNDRWTRITEISADLIRDADKSKNIERKWKVVLDLARFYSESHDPAKAVQELKSIWEFELIVEGEVSKLYVRLDLKLDIRKRHELAVQRKVEEGRIDFVTAKIRLHQGLDGEAMKGFEKAIRCWEAASIGIATWQLDHDGEWTMEIEEMKAEAYIGIGKPEELDKAETILDSHLKRLKEISGLGNLEHGAKRMWDIECKKAHVWIKRNTDMHQKNAIELLQETLKKYEGIYGVRGAWTRNCAYLLRYALRKNKQDKEAMMLEQKYRLQEMGAERMAVVKRPWYYSPLSGERLFSILLVIVVLWPRIVEMVVG